MYQYTRGDIAELEQYFPRDFVIVLWNPSNTASRAQKGERQLINVWIWQDAEYDVTFLTLLK